MTRTSYHLVIAVAWLSHFPLYAQEVFNVHALELDNPAQGMADLSLFTQSRGQPPGIYLVSVYINGERQGEEQSINFVSDEQGKLHPELTSAMLHRWGVKTDFFSAQADDTPIVALERFIPMASTAFIFNQLRLNISIPQAAMLNHTPDAIDSAYWDQGVSAALLNYNLSGGHGWKNTVSDRYYANLQSGVNLGAFRFRDYSIWNYDGKSGGRWQSISRYLQRDIALLKSQFILGDSYSPADVFDSLSFRGVQLASDDNMLPDSLRGFAPVIRGIAHSNAEVTVKQNGYTILRTYVAPGAFTLSDLYPTSAGGDLTVTIREADGSEYSFIQPFSSVPRMQREGRLKYATTVGNYRDSQDKPTFGQFTSMYGLPNGMTVYNGVQYALDYRAYALGIGLGLGRLGAVSADVTAARSRAEKGTSYRLLYSKSIVPTGTNISLAGYRYSTSGFYTFADAFNASDKNQNGNRRQRLQFDISQRLGAIGSLFLSAWQQDYWHKKERELTFSGGWSGQLHKVSYSILYNQSRSSNGASAREEQFAVNIQIPLSGLLTDSWANLSTTSIKRGDTRAQIGIGGNALAERNLSYSVQQSYSKSERSGGNLSADYKGQYAEMNAGYSNSGNARQLNYGLKGGVVLHPYGLTFSQPLADQIAIVRTPGAEGIKVQNFPGIMTDIWGNAVVPYVSPYRKNSLLLNVEDLGDNVDVDLPVKTVIPTQGAVVVASYSTRIGHRVLVSLTWKGVPIPFGTIVSSSSTASGIVGNDGEVYLSGVQDDEHLTVLWSKTQTCNVSLKLPQSDGQSVIRLRGVCR